MTSPQKKIGELTLQLKTKRDTFVQSESIQIEVSITNKGSTSIEIEDLTTLNNPLNFYAIDKSGKEFSGDFLGQLAKEGLENPTPMRVDLKVLEPQEKIVKNVDLLNILGELPVGSYEIKATYQSKGILYLHSNILNIQILTSAPNYSYTFQDYLRMDNPIRTAWIDKEEDGFYLFLMENSPKNPQVLRSNRRIMKLEKPPKVLLSDLESYGQDIEDILWQEDNIIQRAVICKRLFGHKKQINIPISDFQLLKPLLTDYDGKLYFVVLTKEEDASILHLVSCAVGGNIETSEICRVGTAIEKYSIIFDPDLIIHVAYTSRSGDIYHICANPAESPKLKGEAELIASTEFPVLDLQLSLAYFDEEGNRQVLLHYLTEEYENKICSHFLNVGTKKPFRYFWVLVPEMKKLKLLQVTLDTDLNPHFLFQDDSGALLYTSYESAKFVKVTEKGEAYPGDVDCPVLLVSSDLTRHYGIYLRYIKDKSRFIYKKLASLT